MTKYVYLTILDKPERKIPPEWLVYNGVWETFKINKNRYHLIRGPKSYIFVDFKENGIWITDFIPDQIAIEVSFRQATPDEITLSRLSGEI